MTGMSPRQQVADSLADTCIFGGLNDSYGVSCEKSTNPRSQKTYWAVTFCKSRILDGVIEVYSPNFIRVAWQTALSTVSHKGAEVFRSPTAAKDFITKNFINQ